MAKNKTGDDLCLLKTSFLANGNANYGHQCIFKTLWLIKSHGNVQNLSLGLTSQTFTSQLTMLRKGIQKVGWGIKSKERKRNSQNHVTFSILFKPHPAVLSSSLTPGPYHSKHPPPGEKNPHKQTTNSS